MGEHVKPFDEEFLKRTRTIIKHADLLKYNVTLILNCTLSLICLPIERSNTEHQNNLAAYDSLFLSLCNKLNQLQVSIAQTQQNTSPKQKLKCLRNGIAHINMGAMNEAGRIVGVSITGETKYQNIVHSCTFTFNKKQLEEFACFMVDEYLKIR